MGSQPQLQGALGYSSGSGSGSTQQASATSPIWTGQAKSLINQLASNTAATDINSATQSQIGSILANTQTELPGLIADARSQGYNRAANWGQGNIAGQIASALSARDVNLANVGAQAAQAQAQNQLTQRQQTLGLLSLLRGESSTGTSQTKQSQSQYGLNLGFTK